MAVSRFTKAELRKLRELAAEAHSRELFEALRDLDSLFADWRHKHLDSFQLAEAIHEFHNGQSRQLWKLYVLGDPELSVAQALRTGALRESEVPVALRSKLPVLPETRRTKRK
jgi:hypothetical protein